MIWWVASEEIRSSHCLKLQNELNSHGIKGTKVLFDLLLFSRVGRRFTWKDTAEVWIALINKSTTVYRRMSRVIPYDFQNCFKNPAAIHGHTFLKFKIIQAEHNFSEPWSCTCMRMKYFAAHTCIDPYQKNPYQQSQILKLERYSLESFLILNWLFSSFSYAMWDRYFSQLMPKDVCWRLDPCTSLRASQ